VSSIVLLTISVLGQESAPKAINGGVLNGKAVSLPKPEYPETAKAAGVEGVVKVQVTIDENGNIESAQSFLEDSDNDELTTEKTDAKAALREAAERAALEAKFSPTLLSGVPVKVKGVIVYNFKLGGDETEQTTANGTGTGTLNGRAIELPNPEYPDAAKAVRASGIVKVQVTIDENGSVIAAKALSGHPLLQSSAVAAAQKARFEPFGGKEPVKVVGIVTYNFVLPEKKP
jgi:TonB family protein